MDFAEREELRLSILADVEKLYGSKGNGKSSRLVNESGDSNGEAKIAIQRLVASLDETIVSVARISTVTDVLKGELSDTRSAIAELKASTNPRSDVSDLPSKVSNLGDAVTQISGKITAVESTVSSLSTTGSVSDLPSKVANLSDTVAALSGKIHAIEQIVSGLSQTGAAMTSQLAGISSTFSEISTRISAGNQSSAEALAKINERLSSLESQLANVPGYVQGQVAAAPQFNPSQILERLTALESKITTSIQSIPVQPTPVIHSAPVIQSPPVSQPSTPIAQISTPSAQPDLFNQLGITLPQQTTQQQQITQPVGQNLPATPVHQPMPFQFQQNSGPQTPSNQPVFTQGNVF